MPRCFLSALFFLMFSIGIASELQPFRMPWDDASPGIGSLADWQTPILVDAPRVHIDAQAHYSLGSARLRFLGVNIGASDAFPSHSLADAHAARLARFGFNAVRMHHMEAPWLKNDVLVDYSSGNSRKVSAARLERLHYFVAALAAKGIYTDINLLVSREFQPADGLGAEIAQLGWKDQHVLGFFHEGALALHMEMATKILTAPNPLRGGRTLAEDPAVAFVEIMNENGLLQKWFEGVLDTLPVPYAKALQDDWNRWLKSRYPDTASLLAGWQAINQPLGENLLRNGDFSAGGNSWNLERHNGAVASYFPGTTFSSKPSLRIDVTTPSSLSWHVQLTQSGLSVQAGKLYTVRFWAKAASPTPLNAFISRAYGDYGSIGDFLSISNLDTTWREYTVTVTPSQDDANVRIVFNGFGDRVCSVSLADVRVQPGGKVGGLPDGATLEQGTIPIVLRNTPSGGLTAPQKRDWFAYALGAEKRYWDAMNAHIKETLGYKGIVWGTIIANSTPNAQSGLDAMDSHAYWQHPSWPAGKDWDPELWTIPNTSMVNAPDSGTLGSIARQRVQGMPHNVTEYEHPSPNSYTAEGPLLACAYGALQDWDSIWMFSYITGTAEYVTGFFDHGTHPGRMLNNLIAACLFRRGDLGVARREYPLSMNPGEELDAALRAGGAWSIADGSQLGVPSSLSLESRLSLAIASNTGGLTMAPPAPANPSLITSDTAQLTWDTHLAAKGVVTMDSPRTKAVLGFSSGRSFDLGGVVFAPGQTRLGWSTLALSLMEGQSFSHAGGGRALLVATGDMENTGQVWKDATHTSLGSKWGGAPVLVETVEAIVTLPVAASRVQAWALDPRGSRGAALTVTDDSGRARLALGGSGVTLWYEIQIAPAGDQKPVILRQPLGAAVAPGGSIQLEVSADGYPLPEYEWSRNGTVIQGAASARLVVPETSPSDFGAYRVRVTNRAGDAISREVLVASALGIERSRSRLVNVSTRALVGKDAEVMIAGFVVEGGREVLVRAVGPRLVDYGVAGVLADPRIDLYHSGIQTPLASNDDWVPSDISALATSLGAFNLGNSPKESALRLVLENGSHTAIVSGADGGTGAALVEVYDAGVGNGRLLNLSTRAATGAGANSLFVGFVVQGDQPKQVLVRGVGPALEDYGIVSPVPDPKLTLYAMSDAGPLPLLTNDDWEDSDAVRLRATYSSVGAFMFPRLSRDAAMLVWLEPGIYSAMMESKGGAKAIGMVEVYELTP